MLYFHMLVKVMQVYVHIPLSTCTCVHAYMCKQIRVRMLLIIFRLGTGSHTKVQYGGTRLSLISTGLAESQVWVMIPTGLMAQVHPDVSSRDNSISRPLKVSYPVLSKRTGMVEIFVAFFQVRYLRIPNSIVLSV